MKSCTNADAAFLSLQARNLNPCSQLLSDLYFLKWDFVGNLKDSLFKAAEAANFNFDFKGDEYLKFLVEELKPIIEEVALSFGVTHVMMEEIDQINILNASIKGMHRSIHKLEPQPQFIAVDGNIGSKYEKMMNKELEELHQKQTPDVKRTT